MQLKKEIRDLTGRYNAEMSPEERGNEMTCGYLRGRGGAITRGNMTGDLSGRRRAKTLGRNVQMGRGPEDGENGEEMAFVYNQDTK